MAEVTSIPVHGQAAMLGAAAYLAVLAYPSPRDYPKRDKLLEMTKRWMMWRYRQSGGDKAKLLKKYKQYEPSCRMVHAPNPDRPVTNAELVAVAKRTN